jgi:hypothetical protein
MMFCNENLYVYTALKILNFNTTIPIMINFWSEQ